MQTFISATQVVLAVFYTLLIVAYARVFASGRKGLGILARPLLVGTVTLHLLALGILSAERRACPLGSYAEFLSLTAFSVTLTYLILEIRIRERSTGVFALIVPAVLQVIAAVSILGGTQDSSTTQQLGLRASIHSFAAVIGFSAVLLCSVYGLLYLFLYTSIKRGKFGLFFRKITPLDKLSDVNFVATVLAFLAVTVNVVLGFAGAFRAESTVSLDEPAVLLTLLLWALYGGAIAGRRFFGLGGKRLAYTTLTGLVILVLILASGGHFDGQ